MGTFTRPPRRSYTYHMDTNHGGEAGQPQEGEPAEPEAGDQDEEPAPPVHFSTGRLTRAQAATVDAWRERLRTDRPLPGRQRAGEAARLLGASDRPPASCSDAIAAAVAELLRSPPAPLDLARYAYAGMQAQQATAQGQRSNDAAAVYTPASWYLPADIAAQAGQLRADAYAAARRIHLEVAAEAERRHPGNGRDAATARALFAIGELARHGLPPYLRQVPRGAIARMAIDRWARRGAERVAADAVDYAASVHDQPHRARRDMRKLAP